LSGVGGVVEGNGPVRYKIVEQQERGQLRVTHQSQTGTVNVYVR
jgi:hypothetical protein